MKETKNIIQYILNVQIIFFICILCQCNHYENGNKIINLYKYNLYKNKNQCDSINNLTYHDKIITQKNNLIIEKNKIIRSLLLNYSFSEIQVSNNSLVILNTYYNNYEKLIFNQLGVQFFNEKKIYSFGIGHKNYLCSHWNIGNNIFYDTNISKYGGKILSIGNEFFKDSVHITSNIYHDISPNLNKKKYKKYLPHAYDIRIRRTLPFFKKTIGKISIEHYFSNNNSKNFFKKNNNIKQHNSNNVCQLILGVNYTPIPSLSFNIDKIFFNSKKNSEFKFNILVNYKLNLPLARQEKIYVFNRNANNHIKKIENNMNNLIDRNNNIICHIKKDINKTTTFNLIQNYSEEIKTINTTFSKKEDEFKQNQNLQNLLKEEQTSTIFKINENSYAIQIPSPNFTTDSNQIFSAIAYNTNNASSNNTTTIIIKPFNKKQISSNKFVTTKINETLKHKDSSKTSRNKLPLNEKHNNNLEKVPSKNNIDNPNIFSEKNNDNNNYTYIPQPPPMSDFLKKNDTQTNESDIYISIDSSADQNQIKNIGEYKKKKFSALGTTEHLLKLNNITTNKRKKTTSTSSTTSNDSEISTFLKIIERQSTSITNTDTDSDDKDSVISSNEFSDH